MPGKNGADGEPVGKLYMTQMIKHRFASYSLQPLLCPSPLRIPSVFAPLIHIFLSLYKGSAGDAGARGVNGEKVSCVFAYHLIDLCEF